ncbi:hypothetical protein [Kitasatospora sp. NPDC059327]
MPTSLDDQPAREALEPLRLWTACAVSAAALFHLVAAALVLTR